MGIVAQVIGSGVVTLLIVALSSLIGAMIFAGIEERYGGPDSVANMAFAVFQLVDLHSLPAMVFGAALGFAGAVALTIYNYASLGWW